MTSEGLEVPSEGNQSQARAVPSFQKLSLFRCYCCCAIPPAASSSGQWCMLWWVAWSTGLRGAAGGGPHILQPLPGETSAACCVAITNSLTHRDVCAWLSQDCQSLGYVGIFQDFSRSEVVKGQFQTFFDSIGADDNLP